MDTTGNINKRRIQDIARDPSNKICFDCGSPNPQWASVSLGTFFCLECSGLHRSLGVHLSFVRSITMDKWTDEHINRMLVGGNAKAREFFASQPGFEKKSIKEKYNSEAAKQYREKLQLEANRVNPKSGTSGTEQSSGVESKSLPSNNSSLSAPRTSTPVPSYSPSPLGRGISSGATTSSSSFTQGKNELSLPSYSSGDSLSSKSVGGQSIGSQFTSNTERSSSTSFNPQSSTSFSSSTAPSVDINSREFVDRRNQFFLDKTRENSNRPTSLPPSQGGKYEGFGNQPEFPIDNSEREDDLFQGAFSSLSQKLSSLSVVIGEGAKMAFNKAESLGQKFNKNILVPTTTAVKESDLKKNFMDYFTNQSNSSSSIFQSWSNQSSTSLGDTSSGTGSIYNGQGDIYSGSNNRANSLSPQPAHKSTYSYNSNGATETGDFTESHISHTHQKYYDSKSPMPTSTKSRSSYSHQPSSHRRHQSPYESEQSLGHSNLTSDDELKYKENRNDNVSQTNLVTPIGDINGKSSSNRGVGGAKSRKPKQKEADQWESWD